MKVTADTIERPKQDNPQEGNGLACGDINNCSLSILPDWFFHLVLCSASVLGTTGSIRGYLQPSQVAQVVQFLQDGTSTYAVARHFAVSPSTVSIAWRRYQETDHYTRRAANGRRGAQQQDHYLLLCVRMSRRRTARVLQNFLPISPGVHVSDQIVRNRLHEGGMRARPPLVGPVFWICHFTTGGTKTWNGPNTVWKK